MDIWRNLSDVSKLKYIKKKGKKRIKKEKGKSKGKKERRRQIVRECEGGEEREKGENEFFADL